jgi:hypothetical protein
MWDADTIYLIISALGLVVLILCFGVASKWL